MHWTVPEQYRVRLGGNTYIDCRSLVTYKGTSLFDLRRSETDGFLGINLDVRGPDGSRIGTVRNSQFVGPTPDGYAIEGSADRYVLRELATGRAVCDIKMRSAAPEGAELDVSASMYMPDGTLVNGHSKPYQGGHLISYHPEASGRFGRFGVADPKKRRTRRPQDGRKRSRTTWRSSGSSGPIGTSGAPASCQLCPPLAAGPSSAAGDNGACSATLSLSRSR